MHLSVMDCHSSSSLSVLVMVVVRTSFYFLVEDTDVLLSLQLLLFSLAANTLATVEVGYASNFSSKLLLASDVKRVHFVTIKIQICDRNDIVCATFRWVYREIMKLITDIISSHMGIVRGIFKRAAWPTHHEE